MMIEYLKVRSYKMSKGPEERLVNMKYVNLRISFEDNESEISERHQYAPKNIIAFTT